MKKFYDRNEEIQALQKLLISSKKSARFTYIIGQRRIGKTSLVRHVYLDDPKNVKNTLYFFVERKTEDVLAREFSSLVAGKLGYAPDFTTIKDLLLFIFNTSNKQPLTVIFDEFQNFSYSAPSVFSSLQKIWDENKGTAKINLICVGSVYSFMEKIFASKHEPLFGRVTGKIVLKPLKSAVIKSMLKDKKVYSFEYLLELYSMFNGVAKYYEYLEEYELFGRTPQEIFERLFLQTDSPLTTEGKDLLVEEFGQDYQTFFSILEVISGEKSVSNQKIAKTVGINLNNVSTYLSRLERRYNLIKRETPLLVPVSKKGLYKIKDKFLKVWFSVVFPNFSLIESHQKEVMMKLFKERFQNIKGVAFEDLVGEIAGFNYKEFPYQKWGKYWDKGVEIDLLGFDPQKKEMLLGECKLRVSGNPKILITELQRKKAVLQEVYTGNKVIVALFVASPVKKDTIKEFAKEGVKVYDAKALDDLIDTGAPGGN